MKTLRRLYAPFILMFPSAPNVSLEPDRDCGSCRTSRLPLNSLERSSNCEVWHRIWVSAWCHDSPFGTLWGLT